MHSGTKEQVQEERSEDDGTSKKKKELEKRLAEVRSLQTRYLRRFDEQTVSNTLKTHPPTMNEQEPLSDTPWTGSVPHQTQYGVHRSLSKQPPIHSGAPHLHSNPLQTQSDQQQSSSSNLKGHQTASTESNEVGNGSSDISDTDDLSVDAMEEITLYDEYVPQKDPFGCLPPHHRNLQEGQMDDHAEESLKLGYHHELWKTDRVHNISMAAILRSLYLKKNHRASVWLTHVKLSSLHKDVHEHFVVQGSRFGDGKGPQDSVCCIDGLKSLTETSRLREQLNAKGWCAVECCDFIKDAMHTLETVYENAPETKNGEAVWEMIRNKKHEKLKDLADRGWGRKQTSKVGVMELLEDNSEAWKQRAMIDVYIGLIARALKLGMKEGKSFELFMPSTGGRWLGTDRGTDVQDIHCDLTVLLQHFGIVPECTGYFAMVSGSKGFYIWVAERSHILQQCAHYGKNPVVVKKIYVSPFSFFFARGDVFHAGDAYDPVYAQDSIRYHVLLTPKGEAVGNTIEYGPDNVKWIDPDIDS